MNHDLLNKLYGQAFKTILSPYIDETATARYSVSDHVESRSRYLFAELIVRECIDICGAYYSVEGIAQNIDKDIKEHFGIEDE